MTRALVGSPIAAPDADAAELDATIEAPSAAAATTAATGCVEFAAVDPWLRAAAAGFASVLSSLEFAASPEFVLFGKVVGEACVLEGTTSAAAAASVPVVASALVGVAWLFALAGAAGAEGGALAFGFVGASFVDVPPASGAFDPALVVVAGRDGAACPLLAVEPAILAAFVVPAFDLAPSGVLNAEFGSAVGPAPRSVPQVQSPILL